MKHALWTLGKYGAVLALLLWLPLLATAVSLHADRIQFDIEEQLDFVTAPYASAAAVRDIDIRSSQGKAECRLGDPPPNHAARVICRYRVAGMEVLDLPVAFPETDGWLLGEAVISSNTRMDGLLAMPPAWLLLMQALAAWILMRRLAPEAGTPPAAHPHWPWRYALLPATVAMSASLLAALWRGTPDPASHHFAAAVADAPLGLFLSMVVAAPLAEELIFRGVGWRLLSTAFSQPMRILLTSLPFAALHVGQYDALSVLAILLIGVSLGWARARTGSVAICIGGHAFSNLLAYTGLLAAGGTAP